MSRRLIIRPEAGMEVAEAFDWHEDRVSGLGSEFILCVDASFNAIQRNPHQFPRVHKMVRRAITRKFPYEIYCLICPLLGESLSYASLTVIKSGVGLTP